MKIVKKLKTRKVYTARVFDVYEDKLCLPDGRVTTMSRIEHKPSVAIMPVNKNNELLLIKQYRNAINKELIEIPAGSNDKGKESAQACAQRELAEETGYKAKKLIHLFSGYSLPGYCNEYMHYYLALELYAHKLQGDEDEYIELYALPLVKAEQLLKKKKIFDAKTALGISLVVQYFKEKGIKYG